MSGNPHGARLVYGGDYYEGDFGPLRPYIRLGEYVGAGAAIRSIIFILLRFVFSLRAFVLFSCQLTGVAHSGGDSKFGQDVDLQQIPYTYKSNDNQNFFHFLLIIHMPLKSGCPVLFGHQAVQRFH
ncbi:MAG: hypothetical protein C4B57_09735 [Deltaproteobacteria bacterium]|nr:MAG: hypothetical protein C4B57_09735 [Deltaproteobacteria bacterium]